MQCTLLVFSDKFHILRSAEYALEFPSLTSDHAGLVEYICKLKILQIHMLTKSMQITEFWKWKSELSQTHQIPISWLGSKIAK